MIDTQKAITYELTRWDLLANWMSVLLRSRILQVFVVVALFLNWWWLISSKLATRSIPYLIFFTSVFFLGFLLILSFFLLALGLANSFIPKHRGVVGPHQMEITEQGLVERTDYNENLHRWPSIGRIVNLWGYVYIYVSDSNSYQVPKRYFQPSEIDGFVADLRERARQASA